MRRKHSRMMAIILSTIILAGCSNSSHLSVSQTHSSPSATAQPRPTAEPLAVSVSPERSCYQQLYDQPNNPNWALYAEITITNYTDQPLTIETIFLYPNHQFYGEDASTPVLLPEDAIVALRETGLWELHADQISLDSCPYTKPGHSGKISWNFLWSWKQDNHKPEIYIFPAERI